MTIFAGHGIKLMPGSAVSADAAVSTANNTSELLTTRSYARSGKPNRMATFGLIEYADASPGGAGGLRRHHGHAQDRLDQQFLEGAGATTP